MTTYTDSGNLSKNMIWKKSDKKSRFYCRENNLDTLFWVRQKFQNENNKSGK